MPPQLECVHIRKLLTSGMEFQSSVCLTLEFLGAPRVSGTRPQNISHDNNDGHYDQQKYNAPITNGHGKIGICIPEYWHLSDSWGFSNLAEYNRK
jgi:hypothetical protein